jgi:N,N-dimethylformamidase
MTERLWDRFLMPADQAHLGAQPVFFETAGGGGVFSVGSIKWPGALGVNSYFNNVERMTRNVPSRFSWTQPRF